MAVRYKDYVLRLLNENKQEFDTFRSIHDKYSLDMETNQEEFNLKGERILELVREYENRLCANQERGMYNKYSGKLSEKFIAELKKHYPLIDHIGLKTEKFSIKKINLN